MAQPGGGSTGTDQHAYDYDGNPGGVDDLPDPLDRLVVVHGAPLPAVPSAALGVPVRMISVPSAAGLKAPPWLPPAGLGARARYRAGC